MVGLHINAEEIKSLFSCLSSRMRAYNNDKVANYFFEKYGKAQIFGNDTNK